MRISLPEQVSLDFRPAGYGSRSLAYLFDFIIRWSIVCLVPTLVVLVVLWANGDIIVDSVERLIDTLSSEHRTSAGDLLLAAFTLLVFLVEWGYPMYFEVLKGGVTPGKRALGLRVVDQDGLPISFQASLIRTTLLVLDLTVSLSFVGLVSMALTTKRQRLGDLMAGTLVVYDHERKSSFVQPFRALDVPLNAGSELYVPAQLYSALQLFLARREELFHEVRSDLAAELARRLQKYDSSGGPSDLGEDYIDQNYWRLRPRQQVV